MNRTTERLYPYATALAAAAAYWRLTPRFPVGEGILAASITLGAIFVGFLATVMSIVLTIQSAKIEELRKTRFFGLMIDYLQEAIWSALVYCAICLIGFFLLSSPPANSTPPTWFCVAWVFLSLSTFLTFLRITRALLCLISK